MALGSSWFVRYILQRNAGLVNFDGTHLYEYDSDVGRSEWGHLEFNYYRHEVRSFFEQAPPPFGW